MLPRFLEWSAEHADDPPMTREELITLQRSMDTADEEDRIREAERQTEATTHVTTSSDMPTILSVSSESSVDESTLTLFQSVDGTEESVTDAQSLS